MVVLKKIKSSTLVEALVATVLIVIIFIVASLVINNLLLNNFSKNTHQVENRLSELEYNLIHKQIKIPYQENFNKWEIQITQSQDKKTNIKWVEFRAKKEDSEKEVLKKRIYEK